MQLFVTVVLLCTCIGCLSQCLSSVIRGQDEAISFIVNAFSSWEFQKTDREALVLAFTGPTGVGKSETAYRIGEALFQHKTRLSTSGSRYHPCLLYLRGEDYSVAESTAVGVGEVQHRIKSRVVEHIRRCEGNAIVTLDEIQKISPGVLEVLMPGLSERGSFTVDRSSRSSSSGTTIDSYYEMIRKMTQSGPTVQHVSTKNVVFIFISDIGADQMTKMLLTYGDRSLIPKSELRNEVRTALDEQWSRLRFGKVVREVVPFLPLEPVHIRDILKDKLTRLGKDLRLVNWFDLQVDEAVVEHLVQPDYIKYSVVQTQKRPSKQNVDGLVVSCDASASGAGCSEETNNGGSKSKIFATWGARSLDNAGPLQDLKSLLRSKAAPWRPNQVLHVGLLTASNREQVAKHWGNTGRVADLQNQIYFQWCNASSAVAVDAAKSPSVPEDKCETVWFGVFSPKVI